MEKTFVGFGFGPIQSGLFLLEAWRSGNFRRLVVAEVDGAVVDAVRRNRGVCSINVAHDDRVECIDIPGVEIFNPADREDRAQLLAAIAESDEMATALPSVRFYDLPGPGNVAKLIAEGIARRPAPVQTIVYAAENNNEAANILKQGIVRHAEAAAAETIHPIDTVIGKMSGVISDAAMIERKGLRRLAPDLPRAVLVEAFNRILVEKPPAGFKRGIAVYTEKEVLAPFEEAKLYGHNAIHALVAYLADLKGFETVAQARHDEWIMKVAHEAFHKECGAALVARNGKTGDPLFTPEGFHDYAEDLLKRMMNPNLDDRVNRVGRDPERKLGWNDRLIGAMRLALAEGIDTPNLALGAAAGILFLVRHEAEQGISRNLELRKPGGELKPEATQMVLEGIWGNSRSREGDLMIAAVARAMDRLPTR